MSRTFTRQDFSIQGYGNDVSIADVNGDGKLDLVVAASGMTTDLLVLLGDGTGGFTTSASIDVVNYGINTGFVALADMDGDGDLDIFYAAYNDTAVRLLRNDGAGGYQPGSLLDPGMRYVSIAADDINGDGRMDVVGIGYNGSITAFLGDGAGGFQSIIFDSSGGYLWSNYGALADMDGDGKLDLVTSSSITGGVSVLLGDGAGGFATFSAYGVDSWQPPSFVTVADVNGDGKMDALVNGYDSVTVLLGDGTGNFTSSMLVNVERTPESIAVADLNGDGKLDLITANSFYNTVAVRWGDGTGNFSGGTNVAIGYTLKAIRVADINKDGEMDIVVTGSNGVTVLLGGEKTVVTEISSSTEETGTLKIGDTITFTLSTDLAVTVTGVPELVLSNGGHAVYAGLDGDGRPTFTYTIENGDGDTDNLSVTGLDTTNGVVDRYAEMSFATPTSVNVGLEPDRHVVVDVNGDGKLDILTANFSNNSVSVRLGDGHGGFSGSTQIAVGSNPFSIAAGDVNGDGKMDMLVGIQGNATVSVLLGDGAGGFSGSSDINVAGTPTFVALADVNGDGKLDLLTARYSSDSVLVSLGDGTGNFTNTTQIGVGYSPISIAVSDVNGDGKLDFLTTNQSGNTVSVRLGNGAGGFSGSTTVIVGDRPASVVVVDLNGDGKLDMLAANQGSDSVSVCLGDGAGGFTGLAEISVGDGPTSVVAADMNGDGKLDLLTANHDGTGVSVRMGDGAGGFSGSTEIDLGAGAISVAAADVNGDGWLDIVATKRDATVGIVLNTSHKAAPFDGSTISTAEGAETGRDVDATRPDTPTISLTSDTGTSTIDKITRDGALTPGALEDGATLSYIVDDGAASASYTPSDLADGEHTVKVIQTDAAGNASLAGSITFILDRSATAPGISLVSDTGSLSNDKVTSNGALDIDEEDGATLSYSIDNGVASASYTPSGLADGRHTIKVIQTDKAGNVSSAGEITFTLDRTAPIVTGVTTSGPDVSGGSGTLTTGETATFSVTMKEAVAITNPTALTLKLSNGKVATYDAAASTATKLVFIYKVGLEDIASDLSAGGIALNGATVKDIAGNTANLAGAIANPAGTLVIDGYTGTAGADAYRGAIGAQTYRGLGGNDTYVVNDLGDRVIEAVNQGTDTVSSSVSFTLGDNVEKLTLTGSAALSGYGNSLANAVTGNSGNNTLDGKAGDDTLDGGSGDDILIGGAGADKLIGGSGTDTASYVGAAKGVVANLTNAALNTNDAKGDTYSAIENLTGSSYNDTLTGNTGANTLDGGAGDDILIGGAGADKLIGGAGTDTASYAGATKGVVANLTNAALNTNDAKGDTYSAIENLTGSSYNDTLIGNSGVNTLDGGAGDDILIGGAGADKLIGGAGTDTASYAGATKGVVANLTNAALNTNDAKRDTYSAIENLTGSSYNDTLTGNTGANTLDGGGGDDTLIGSAGADKLIGGAGTDTASYAGATKGVVANLTNAALNTNDAKGDTYSAIENLTGSSYNDTLTGNTGVNTLDGGAGDDTLIGGAGADKLIGGTGTDTASYAGATKGVVANLTNAALNTNDAKGDTYSSIENLTGSSYNDVLTGNTGANKISGGAGDDKLYGGLGKDILIGGSGKDTFVFDTKLGSTNIDTIDDFIVKDDTIWLDDDIFTKAGKVGDLSGEAFYAGTKAHDASDRVIYEKATGKLWYDADGSGKGEAIQFATLDKGLVLTAADFDIIA